MVIPLDFFGIPECTVVHDCALKLDIPADVNGGYGWCSLPLPLELGFTGLMVYQQAWALAPGWNQADIVLTNAIELRLGSYF